ncbi:RIP metalloprotease RseP [Ectothiorhodospiraceae bacterium WFHF3C12]|nr:RIP metalloprotease RseP [Ectothiorhodospiraceae bacterium WFHF3C12]
MAFVNSVLAFIVAIGVLVTVHEFGHFWVARRLGMKVLRFSVGFGKPLLSRRGKDGTEYVISALPLGGYVKLLDEREGDVPEDQRHLAFNRQPNWARSAVLVAGPAFNFIFAVVAYWLIFVVGYASIAPIVGEVREGSAAAAAGLQSEDRIVAVAGSEVRTWDEAVKRLVSEGIGGNRVPVTVEASSGRIEQRVVDFGLAPELSEGGNILSAVGVTPWMPTLAPVVERVSPGEAAERAGLQPGDRVVAAGGDPVESWQALVAFVQERPGQEVTLTVERAGAERQMTLTLGSREVSGGEVGLLGVSPRVPEGLYDEVRQEVRYGPLAAIAQAAGSTWEDTALTLNMLWKIVLGEASVKNLSGPINIAQYAGESASLGMTPFLRFLALVSISLGVLNLLPVPVLDGGHLLYNAIEAVRGKPLSESAQGVGQQIGLALLIMLMGLAFYNDLLRIFGPQS